MYLIMTDKELTFEERKRIQLEMLDEIDAFCRANDIRYSIAFGTLLGAIRHKGFIPWDDDVDIMMPLPDLLKFKSSFKSDKLEYIDVDVNDKYAFSFSRVAHKNTYQWEGKAYKSYGICIDLYVLIGIPKEEESFFHKAQYLYGIRKFFTIWRGRIMRRLPVSTIPFFSKSVRKCRDYLWNHSVPYEEADRFYVIAGPLKLRNRMTYDKDIFNEMIDLNFENRTYRAIADWDYYLTLRYGDYMQLPPEDQRQPYHNMHCYWR